MNPAKIILALLILVFGLFTPSCKKYKEDPFISLKQPGKRLQGGWKFTGYTINGVDHSHDFDNYLTPYTLTDCIIVFNAQQGPNSVWYQGLYFIYNGGGTVTHNSMSYNLRAGDDITITSDSALGGHLWKGHPEGSLGTEFSAVWPIRKLYKNDLHLRKDNIDIYFRRQ